MDSFEARSVLQVDGREYEIFALDVLSRASFSVARLPYSLRILPENLLRGEDGITVSRADIEALAGWRPGAAVREIAFAPARVLLQDFTGVPAVVDLASMRDAMARLGGDPARINPIQPVELVIDHFERIHRSNLVGMGILPLQFLPGESVEAPGLTGREEFDILDVQPAIAPGRREPGRVRIITEGEHGAPREFQAVVRIDTPQEAEYYRRGGILQYVLRQLLAGRDRPRVGLRGPTRLIAPMAASPLAKRDALVDEGSVESFPASDPPAY
jgi:aconitase A